ncbi:MAG: hypothetical protein ACTHMS_22575, partial [Jatrophihabitans sp.]|uniref:hypothetical protein n=1 Tax=Jatrophihabitans sp. TaxID=1932789 RepID=UPI003F7F0AC6
ERGEAVEPPTVHEVGLTSGLHAQVMVAHLRADDGDARTEVRLFWQPHPLVVSALVAASVETSRVLLAREDIVALAGGIVLQLFDDPQAPR